MSKCSDQIFLLTKLKENRLLGTEEEEDKEEKGGKEKLILMNR